VAVGILQFSIHKVDEGYVGIYYRGGALVNRITYPGWHLRIPLFDSFDMVQVNLQTDKVIDIPCGTSGGVMITFDRVEVVNKLNEKYVYDTIKNYTVHYDKIMIFDKIHHEINQFCSKHTLQEVYIDLFSTVDDQLQIALQESCAQWAPGIEIIAVRITKPRIPPQILKNYEAMEAEKTKLLIAVQAQKVAEKEAETEKKKATIEAEKIAEVSKIKMEQEIMERTSMKEMKRIEDEGNFFRAKMKSDSDFYEIQKSAEAHKMLFTPEFVQIEAIRAIGNNTKLYLGPSVLNLFLDFFDTIQAIVPKK